MGRTYFCTAAGILHLFFKLNIGKLNTIFFHIAALRYAV